MMKWDVKHDLAKQVISGYLERAKTELPEHEIVAGLSDEDKAIVSEELSAMIESINKRYKLQERLPEQPKKEPELVALPEAEKPAEPKEEAEKAEEPAKPKRGRKKTESTGEKKERKPRAKKEKEVVA